MIGYVVGPVIAVLVSMKFTDFKSKRQKAECSACCEKIELLEQRVTVTDHETLKKMLITVTPIAKAVQQLQEAVGVQ